MNHSIPSWDGTLSMNEFSITAHFFADKWRTHNSLLPPWSWLHHETPNFVSSHIQVIGYLSLERFCLFRSLKDEEVCGNGEEVSSFLEKVEAVDDATLVRSDDCQVHYYDFHIVYSESYRVPVLYFRAYSDDGQPLALNEIEKDLPAASVKVLSRTKWTFITQEEHPYLNRPWYKLHPCATSEWMKLLFCSDSALSQQGVAVQPYLAAWFSVVGQVVGLRVPIEMLALYESLGREEMYFGTGGFKKLKTLWLGELHLQRQVEVMKGAMLCLENLQIFRCPILENVQRGALRILPNLKILCFHFRSSIGFNQQHWPH